MCHGPLGFGATRIRTVSYSSALGRSGVGGPRPRPQPPALEFLRSEFGQPLAALLGVHPVDPLDDRRDNAGYLVAVLAELRVLAHERAHYCADLCLAVVFHRVEKRVLLGLSLDALSKLVVHYRSLPRRA